MNIFLVGGAVRDKLLGYPFHERDWVVVGGSPEQLLELGYQAAGKDFPVFLHPDSREEYALARTERKQGHGYTGFECFASPDVCLEEDLQRRDLTINAMAETDDGCIVDPYGGQQDLQDKCLRHVSEAFIEDPLRVLRVARFMARYKHLGFSVADETLALMRSISASGELQTLPPERLWREFERALGEQSPLQFIDTLKDCGAQQQLLPELPEPSPAILHAIQLAVRQQRPTLLRFAVLLSTLPDKAIEKLCQRLKPPKDFRELALLLSHYQKLASTASNAKQRLQLLEQLDAFRRPQRLQDFLQCCQLLQPDSTAIEQLQTAYQQCRDINARALVEQGITGKAVAAGLRQLRLTAIEEKL